MLKINPEERLGITELVNQLQEVAAARNANPKSPITEVKLINTPLPAPIISSLHLEAPFAVFAPPQVHSNPGFSPVFGVEREGGHDPEKIGVSIDS